MNKADLVDAVTPALGNRREAQRAVDAFFSTILEAGRAGDPVDLDELFGMGDHFTPSAAPNGNPTDWLRFTSDLAFAVGHASAGNPLFAVGYGARAISRV